MAARNAGDKAETTSTMRSVLPAMRLQERLEGCCRCLALAARGEHHGVAFTVQIDEHGDVVVAPLGCPLVEGEGLQGFKSSPARALRT